MQKYLSKRVLFRQNNSGETRPPTILSRCYFFLPRSRRSVVERQTEENASFVSVVKARDAVTDI